MTSYRKTNGSNRTIRKRRRSSKKYTQHRRETRRGGGSKSDETNPLRHILNILQQFNGEELAVRIEDDALFKERLDAYARGLEEEGKSIKKDQVLRKYNQYITHKNFEYIAHEGLFDRGRFDYNQLVENVVGFNKGEHRRYFTYEDMINKIKNDL